VKYYSQSTLTIRLGYLLGTVLVSLTCISCAGVESTPPAVVATDNYLTEVPDWTKQAIWYQIFPDRFNNGDKHNDPDGSSLEGTWPYTQPEGWKPSPWTSDWYKLQPWEEATGEDFWYNSQLRRYGGDLQGVIDKLDYLSDLGINAIYMNPVFESASLHKYGCTMWHHIDNNFGPDPAGDVEMWADEDPGNPETWQWTSADSLFLKLIDLAHKCNIRVIIDGVFNHTGIPFWAFDDIRKKGLDSDYADWFTILSFDNPETEENELDYKGWYGVKDLPELAEDEHGPSDGVKEHLQAVVKRWMDPNGDGDPSDGIDGWRLDVAEMVAQDFWKEFRIWCREINPESYLVGEVWWEDFGKDKMFNASEWVEGDIFDAVMNYRFGDALLRGIVDQKVKIDANSMDSLLAIVRNSYRVPNQYALMSVFNSHDTERLASMVTNPDRTIDHGGSSRDQREFYLGPPNESQRLLQRTMLLFQFSYIGAPLIYYGDEVGMWGADDPDCRKPMVWAEMDYDDEVVHPYGSEFGPFPVSYDGDLFSYYQALVRLRNNEAALQTGSYKTLLAHENKFAFQRSLGSDNILVILNLGDVAWELSQNNKDINLEGWKMILDSSGDSGERLGGKTGRIYKKL